MKRDAQVMRRAGWVCQPETARRFIASVFFCVLNKWNRIDNAFIVFYNVFNIMLLIKEGADGNKQLII